MTEPTAAERVRAEQYVQRWFCHNNEILWERGGHYKDEVAALCVLLTEARAEGLEERSVLLNLFDAVKAITNSNDVVLAVTDSMVDAETLEESPTLVTQDYVNELWNCLIDAVDSYEDWCRAQAGRRGTR